MVSRTTRALLAFAILITLAGYFYVAIPSCVQPDNDCAVLDTAIISHTATSPYQYRILAPELVYLLTPNAFVIGYALLHLIALAILYPALYTWFRRWMADDRAMLCIFVTVVLFWYGFSFYYLSGWTVLEVMFVALALVSLDKPLWVYVLLVGLGALNRETTGVLLIAIYAVNHLSKWRETAFLIVGWLAITASLHITLGNAPLYITLEQTVSENFRLLPRALLANFFLLPMVYLTAANFRHSTAYLKRLALIACGYTCMMLIAAQWLEFPRLLLAVVPLVLPMALAPERVSVKWHVTMNSEAIDPKRFQQMAANSIRRAIDER